MGFYGSCVIRLTGIFVALTMMCGPCHVLCAEEAEEPKPETPEKPNKTEDDDRYKRFRTPKDGEKPVEAEPGEKKEPVAETVPAETPETKASEVPAETTDPAAEVVAEGEQPAEEKESREDEDEPELAELYTDDDTEGAIGRRRNKLPVWALEHEPDLPVPDRYRLGMTENTMRVKGHMINPYRQNVLKGDYPIIGQNIFFSATAASDTFAEFRDIPTPSGNNPALPFGQSFFGKGDSILIQQNFILSLELFAGQGDFKPRAWEIRATPVFNLNYVHTNERLAVNLDARKGRDRLDHQIAFQELFGEYHFWDISPNYDFIAGRAGIQLFNVDHRGWLFNDFNLGARLFGNYENNRLNYNLAYFNMLNKDTNSELNSTFTSKDEHVIMANLIRQDTLIKGYDIIGQVAFSSEEPSTEYNQNGVIVRPAPIGTIQEHHVKALYMGFGGNGHIGRMNITHQFYQVWGHDTFNNLAGKRQEINAQMAALELSVDVDWSRFRASYFYASGDPDPTDSRANGFDAIFDNPNFSGGQFSYWVRQGLGAGNTFTSLKSRLSLLPNLATSKIEGQSNFVNPGVHIFNVGYDAELLPHLKAIANVNYIQFDKTDSLELLLNQNGMDRNLGWDYSLGVVYRPLLNQQIILTGGIAVFQPEKGWQDLYEDKSLKYSGFMGLTLKY